MKYRRLKDIPLEELTEAVKNSTCWADLQRKLGYEYTASRQPYLQKLVNSYKIDTTHFTGQGWNKNNFDYSRFKYGNNIKAAAMLRAIVALRGHKCECCGREEWDGQPIPLEVHHEDGNHLNNELTNLKLLCPNCHALTENWRGKNISSSISSKIISDEDLIKILKESVSVRQALLKAGLTGAGGNYDRAYKLINLNHITHLMKQK